jgi:putative hydrolase of the HAD superfamily
MLRAVTFDLWQTLIKERPEASRRARADKFRRLRSVLRKEGIIRDSESIKMADNALDEHVLALWDELRDIGARKKMEWLLDFLQVKEQNSRPESLIERLIDAYTLPILKALPVPMEGAPDVLTLLAARGFRMGVICNTGRTPGKGLRIILERLGMAKHLAVQTFSDEIGLRKPRPEIFERTLAELKVHPSEALHVGDTLAADIAGAQSVGMRAVHLCHERGADPRPGIGETIFSLPELLALV